MRKHAFFVIPLLVLSSCATIVKDSSQQVTFANGPRDKEVEVMTPYGSHRIHESGTFVMNRSKSDVAIKLRCEGKETPVVLNTHFDALAGIVGNLFSFWIVGGIIDAVGDKAYDYQKAPVDLSAACPARIPASR